MARIEKKIKEDFEILDKKDKLKEIISLKRQFIFEEFNYEKKILLGIIGIGLAVTAYLYQNPIVNWLLALISFVLLGGIYELFVFLKMQERVNCLKKEINEEVIENINSIEDLTEPILDYIWGKVPTKIKIKVVIWVLTLIGILMVILYPFIYNFLFNKN